MRLAGRAEKKSKKKSLVAISRVLRARCGYGAHTCTRRTVTLVDDVVYDPIPRTWATAAVRLQPIFLPLFLRRDPITILGAGNFKLLSDRVGGRGPRGLAARCRPNDKSLVTWRCALLIEIDSFVYYINVINFPPPHTNIRVHTYLYICVCTYSATREAVTSGRRIIFSCRTPRRAGTPVHVYM